MRCSSAELSVSPSPASETSPRLFYGWIMLGITTLGLMCTAPGQSFGVSVFRPFIQDDLGLAKTDFSFAYLIATLLGATPLFAIGAIMDRYGPRRVIFVVVLALLAGCVVVSQAFNWWSLLLGLMMLRMFGQASLGMLSTTTLALWFDRKLGLVNGIMATGMAIAIAGIPTLSEQLIDFIGWRYSYIVLGLIAVSVMLPLLAIAFKNRPEDIGQYLDGDTPDLSQDTATEQSQTTAATATRDSRADSWTLGQAMRTPAFWLAAVCFAFFALAITAFILCMGPVFESQGLTDDQAAQYTAEALLAMGITLMAGQLIAGRLADILPQRLMLTAGMAFLATAAFVLYLPGSHHYVLLMGVTMGLTQASVVAAGGTIWPRYYGRAHIGKIKGTVTKVFIAASALGPFILDSGFALTGSYKGVLIAFMLIPLVLGVGALFAVPPKRA